MLNVAHVFRALDAGGIEKWLTDVAIENDKKKIFKLNFLLQSTSTGFFEKKIPDDTVMIHKKNLADSKINYLIDLYKIFRKERYDVVHSHVHHTSGIILLIAFLAGIKIRVAHCHNDKRDEYKKASITKRISYIFYKIMIILFSNRKISVSDNAQKSLFPISKSKILPCGLILSPPISSASQKIKNRFIIGHIGSFSIQKNHKFIIEIAKYLNKNHPGKYEFKLVGNGKLFAQVEKMIRDNHLDEIISLLGLRDDIKDLISNDFDAVILPSLHEGLAMVALETQYYGKPLILSDSLSKQHSFSSYIYYASNTNAEEFSQAIIKAKKPTDSQVIDCRLYLDNSPLTVSNNMKELENYYISASSYEENKI